MFPPARYPFTGLLRRISFNAFSLIHDLNGKEFDLRMLGRHNYYLRNKPLENDTKLSDDDFRAKRYRLIRLVSRCRRPGVSRQTLKELMDLARTTGGVHATWSCKMTFDTQGNLLVKRYP